MKFSLPITRDYVSGWNTWTAVRELVQNAKDEEDDSGNRMSVDFANGVLSISNENASIDRSALLLGRSTKRDKPSLRGQFGEGLDLALLVLARNAIRCEIETPTERWVPSIETAPEYGDHEVLVITTRKRRKPGTGVTAKVWISEDEWTTLRSRFTFLTEIAPESKITIPGEGAILLAPEYRGQLFVKGIFVAAVPKMACGYDLDHLELDRDRRIVKTWDLQWRLGYLYRKALEMNPGAAGPMVYTLLSEGAMEAETIGCDVVATPTHINPVVEVFRAKHGPTAFPVTCVAEAKRAEYLGRKPVSVPRSLAEALRVSMGSVDDLKPSTDYSVVEWTSLSAAEREILDNAMRLITSATGVVVENVVEIVDFVDPDLEGLCRNGEVKIARKCLCGDVAALKVLIHEVSHARTGADDGDPAFTAVVEDTWASVYGLKTQRN